MLPILLKLGPITLYSYGLFLILGLFAGLYWLWKIGRDEHWDETKLFDMYFVALFVYLFVGRVGYVALNPELYSVWRALSLLSHPGILPSLGIIASTLTIVFISRREGWESWKVMDAWVVVLSTIMVPAALGAILNGSMPGLESSAFGYIHPGDSVARIPVDVFSFFWSLVTFGVVSRVRKNFRFYSWYKGEASVARDGLAALVWGVLACVYYVCAGFLLSGQRIGVIPVLSILGLLGICILVGVIYWRGGKNRGEALLSRLRRKDSV